MGLTDKPKITIGRAEKVDFPELGFYEVPTRIDTGAGTAAIWAESVKEAADGGLDVVFFGPSSPFYTGEARHIDSFGQTEVRSSNGQTEVRYTIRTKVTLGGKKIRATFTLADRSTQLYPVLIGRNVLRGKFIVDVKLGTPLAAEKEHNAALKAKYGQGPKE
jgi:hypothetical protein